MKTLLHILLGIGALGCGALIAVTVEKTKKRNDWRRYSVAFLVVAVFGIFVVASLTGLIRPVFLWPAGYGAMLCAGLNLYQVHTYRH